MSVLRKFIRFLIEAESKKEKSDKSNLLTEPDEIEGREEDEASVVGGIVGVTTPLGAGPTYPNKPDKRRKSSTQVAGRSFGNAVPVKRS